MGYLDTYAKEVLRAVAGEAFLYCGPSVFVNYGSGQPCRIDGTVGGIIAVQMESAYSKQARGAIFDLLCHPYPQKLLILLPNRNTLLESKAGGYWLNYNTLKTLFRLLREQP
jgi:hypothetical protein